MKSYQVILLVIATFTVGVLAGPTILELVDNARLQKTEKTNYSNSEKELLDKNIRDYAYYDLLTRIGPPEKALERLDANQKICRKNNLVLVSIINQIELMETRLRVGDTKGLEHNYNAILKLIDQNPRINKSSNLRDIALINYAHCLAGKSAALEKDPKLANKRFEAAIKVLSEIDDLYWLATYAYNKQAQVFIEEKEYKKAIANFTKIYRYQLNNNLNASGDIFKINLLINLAYLNLKIGDKKLAFQYARKGLSYTSLTAEQRKSKMYQYFHDIKDAAKNTKDSEKVLESQKDYWQRSLISKN